MRNPTRRGVDPRREKGRNRGAGEGHGRGLVGKEKRVTNERGRTGVPVERENEKERKFGSEPNLERGRASER